MSILLTYSSKTGNTEAVAKAIAQVLPEGSDFLKISEVKNVDKYDAVIIGFWVDQSLPNKEALEFIKTLKNKKIGYFFTLGAYADSKHAQDCHAKSVELLTEHNNEIISAFCCQGKIDPALTPKFKELPKGHPHYMDEARIKRHQEAALHPDAKDFENAQTVFKDFIHKISQ